jgi:hypothetical protein
MNDQKNNSKTEGYESGTFSENVLGRLPSNTSHTKSDIDLVVEMDRKMARQIFP